MLRKLLVRSLKHKKSQASNFIHALTPFWSVIYELFDSNCRLEITTYNRIILLFLHQQNLGSLIDST